jgi:hypothetical protein
MSLPMMNLQLMLQMIRMKMKEGSSDNDDKRILIDNETRICRDP